METRKDNTMTTNPVSPKEKKLHNLRNIQWIVFSAIAAVILLVGSLSLPAALWINNTPSLSNLAANETGMILLTVLALALVKIAASGIICLVIYYIFKYRLEKDDDLFL
jgi:hypothetical protein